MTAPTKYVEPSPGANSFTCPHCGVLALFQHWGYADNIPQGPSRKAAQAAIGISKCQSCGDVCLWRQGKVVYPISGGAPLPNQAMPEDVRAAYIEATEIHRMSPRGAAALLRLAIQMLCSHLGGQGENINDDIGKLVADGLPKRVQKALDIVRVTGNNAVHPGQIDADDPEAVGNLLTLVNVITEYMIEFPNRVDALYEDLPDGTRAATERRDNSN